jgi:ATP-dependent RNA helicase DDX31/DBP7
MADDGLIINFVSQSTSKSTNNDAPPRKVSQKQMWKEKIQAKKMAKKGRAGGYQEQARNFGNSESSNLSRNETAPSKPSTGANNTGFTEDEWSALIKKSTTQSIEIDQPDLPELNIRQPLPSQAAAAPPPASKQIISSLFSKNPHIPKAYLQSKRNNSSTDPSNGVLNKAESFKELKIDDCIINHLSSKFEIEHPTPIQSKSISFTMNNEVVRDLVLQAQTGSGKSLAFLLPIVDCLVKASLNPPKNDNFLPSRSAGTFGVILAPTRELAKQIYDVLNKLLSYPVHCETDSSLRKHWIVPGLTVGGDNKSSEKARIRKGMNLLVSTPGRFLDHLQNTKSLNVDQLRWLVLDEGDRFFEPGMQDTLNQIFDILRKKDHDFTSPWFERQPGQWFWSQLPSFQQTILCSATLNSNVQNLAKMNLKSPVYMSASSDLITLNVEELIQEQGGQDEADNKDTQIGSIPKQLKQYYIPVPAKLRLVTLTTLLRTFTSKPTSKIIVFLLTCDSVDFHHFLLTTSPLESLETMDPSERLVHEAQFKKAKESYSNKKLEHFELSELLNNTPILKLHGDMEQKARLGTYQSFCKLDKGILLCTDVAARGLDINDVTQVVQYDPPTDVKDYVHRVGRTARLGKSGEACLFLMPSELEYLDILKGSVDCDLGVQSVDQVLKNLDNSEDYENSATQLQLTFEKHLLSSNEVII